MEQGVTVKGDKKFLIIKIILFACIAAYPLVTSFLGIDLGDTGIHMYTYDNIVSNPKYVGFTAYFTSLTGWAWMKVFPGLGIWGLNLLEVFLELGMVAMVYTTFRKTFGDIQTLIGLLIAVMASDTYINVFNYHQYNVFFLIFILCFVYKAITKQKNIYSFWAGIFFALVVFSRMGSVTAIVTCLIYIFWYMISDETAKKMFAKIGFFLLGTCAMGALMVLLLLVSGQMQYFINNISRLSGMASTAGSSYGMDSLLSTFIFGNLDAIASGFIYLAAAIVLLLGLNLLFSMKGYETKKKVVNVLVMLLATGVSAYLMIYAYNVNEAPAWPQMTTAPSFLIGVLYTICFFYIYYNVYAENGNKEAAVIGVCAIFLPLLTIAGSNTGTKHVILALWIIAPLAVSAIWKLVANKKTTEYLSAMTQKVGITIHHTALIVTAVIVVLFVGFKFALMVYQTSNFDSIHRTSLRYSIECDKLKFMKTTKREADSVNGVLNHISLIQDRTDEELPLMVYGGSILLYSLTEMRSYIQPWITNTNYAEEKMIADLAEADGEWNSKPVIIWGRTNNYFGFEEYNYDVLIQTELKDARSGRKDYYYNFLQENNYKLDYVNDYYLIFVPEELSDSDSEDYRGYIYPEY